MHWFLKTSGFEKMSKRLPTNVLPKRIPTTKLKDGVSPSLSRYIPDKPPAGPFKHLSWKEIGKSELLVPKAMDKKACFEEKKELLSCWTANGANNVDINHPCFNIEEKYKKCIAISVCIIYKHEKTFTGPFNMDSIFHEISHNY